MTHLPTHAILVTQAALEAYARARHLQPAEAHRELLTLLVGREIRQQPGRRLAQVRARSRTLQVDVDAHLEATESLFIVISVRVRDYL